MKADSDDVLLTIPKGNNAEIRVTKSKFHNRRVIDIRVWSFVPGSDEMVRTRKGITIGESSFPEFVEGLKALKL